MRERRKKEEAMEEAELTLLQLHQVQEELNAISWVRTQDDCCASSGLKAWP